jgi:ubiquinone/menaquinone biosynthesis C-methylase UbiE
MVNHAREKVKEFHLKNIKEIVVGDVQKLEEYFPVHSFNFVTSRCVFCFVPDPIKGLKQISRVLKPNGKFVQLEYGLSKSRTLNLALKIFDPIISKRYGLHLNRDHIQNLKDMDFKIVYQQSIEPTGVFKLIISKME